MIGIQLLKYFSIDIFVSIILHILTFTFLLPKNLVCSIDQSCADISVTFPILRRILCEFFPLTPFKEKEKLKIKHCYKINREKKYNERNRTAMKFNSISSMSFKTIL